MTGHEPPFVSTNRLKSIFVAVYSIAVVVVAVGSVLGVLFSDYPVAWAGALLTVLPFLTLYIRATRTGSLARTSRYLPVASAITLGGLAVSIIGASKGQPPAALPLLAAAVGTAGFFLYDVWYSSLGKRINDCLAEGRLLPDFQARDVEGREVRASDLRGHKALFMFYRGNWCPFCMAQVKEITGKYRELAALGVELVLISPQPTDLTERVADMFQVPCRFWVDDNLGAARELGIVHEHGVPAGSLTRTYGEDTVLPTVIIVDAEGRILFTDQTDNYRVRPDPEDFLKALRARSA